MRTHRPLLTATGLVLLVGALGAPSAANAQELPRPEDVASPEAIVAAAYASIARAPGETYDWDRFRSLHLPEAILISNPEQRGGFDVLSVQEFIDWIDGVTTVGGPDDRGFSEDEIHNVVNRYGDVANVFSTYEKHFYGDDQNLGRGINTFNVVWHDGRWWIMAIAWDEETGAGPIPKDYLP